MRPCLEHLETRETPSVTYQGGIVLQNPRVAEVFAGPYRADLDQDVRTVVSSYLPWLGIYGIGTGVVDAVWQAGTRPLASSSDVAALLREGIRSGNLPAPDGVSQMYIVFTADDIGAFHAFSGKAPYAVSSLSYPPNTVGPSHEIIEVCSDPYLEAWYQGSPADGEICDLNPYGVLVDGRVVATAVAPDGVTHLSGPTALAPVQPYPKRDLLVTLKIQSYIIAADAYALGNFFLADYAYNFFLYYRYLLQIGYWRLYP